jgi:Transposase DDE domain/Domain of unknown function (DUF4372)
MIRFNSTILNQIIQYGKISSLKNKVSKYNSDKGTSKFNCFSIFVIMIASQFLKRDKLREIQDTFEVNSNCMYHLGLKSVKRSSLADALKTRNHIVFEEHFYTLLEELKSMDKRKYRKQIKILDSTTIGLCKTIFEWAKFRSTKSGIKIHIMFDDRLSVPIHAIMTKAKDHDVKIAKKFDIEKNQIYVFDRGYNDYNYFYKIHKNMAFFVTRLKKNAKFRVLKKKLTGNKYGVISERIIKIIGTNKDSYNEQLRLIEYYDKETDKLLKFVTNNFKMKAQDVADIYKRRWQIELFFKWLKGHFKVKKFLSTTENGVKIQIWCALIAYIILMLIRKECQINISAYELLRIIEGSLFRRINLFEVLEKIKLRRFYEKNCLKKETYLW